MFNQGVPRRVQSARACPDAGLISKAASGSRPIIRYSEEKKKKGKKFFLLYSPRQADLNDERLNDIPETSQMSNMRFLLPFRIVIYNLPSFSGSLPGCQRCGRPSPQTVDFGTGRAIEFCKWALNETKGESGGFLPFCPPRPGKASSRNGISRARRKILSAVFPHQALSSR